MSIDVKGVSKRFAGFEALKDVSLEVRSGELLALLGPSGSGKTTLLRIIAGLEEADRGQVLFGGQDLAQTGVQDRGVGFVFQHYALFRHLSAFENVAFGLRVKPRRQRPAEAQIREKVMSLLRLVQLEAWAQRRPSELSGGQRQRVALARALAVEPKVLLLDEPFGSLDAEVRRELRRWLRRLHDEIKVTSVFVTHDQEEALEVADRVVVMNAGRIEQVGTPQEILDHPASAFVMRFLGRVNVFHGRDGAPASYARPYELDLERSEEGGGGLWATLLHVAPGGATVRLELERDGQRLQVEMPRDRWHSLAGRPGEAFYLRARQVRTFPAVPADPQAQPFQWPTTTAPGV